MDLKNNAVGREIAGQLSLEDGVLAGCAAAVDDGRLQIIP